MQRALAPSADDASPVAVSAKVNQPHDALPTLTATLAFSIIPPQIMNMVVGYLTPENAFRFVMHTSKALRNRALTWTHNNELVFKDKSKVKLVNKETVYYAMGAAVAYDSLDTVSAPSKPSDHRIAASFTGMVFVFEDKTTAEFFKKASDIYDEYYLYAGHFIKACKIVGSENYNQLAVPAIEKNIQPNEDEQMKGSAIPLSIFRTSGKTLTYLKEEEIAPKKSGKTLKP